MPDRPDSHSGLLGCDVPLAQAYDLALVDLDGVTYLGTKPIDNAATGLNKARDLGLTITFVTNNASRTPAEVAAQLTSLDIKATPDEILTSSKACAQLLQTKLAPGAKVLVIGADALRAEVKAAGFTIVDSADDKPDAVAQGFAPELAWKDLAEAAYAIENGAWYVATNLDKSLPTARGFAPGCGSLVGAVEAATHVKAESIGKPDPAMYQFAARTAGAKNPLVVGDRLDTDLSGARAASYPGLLVLTGVSKPREVVLAPPELRPCYLGADLLALLRPHPVPSLGDDGWWTCNGRRARVTDGKLELADGTDAFEPDGPCQEPVAIAPDVFADDPLAAQINRPDGLDLLRAACAAAWSAADAGHPVTPESVPETFR